MKNTIVLLFVAIVAYGQNGMNPSSKKNLEFGFNIYSLNNFRHSPLISATDKDYLFDQNFFPGLFVKKHFNKNILRMSFDYNKRVINDRVNTSHHAYKNDGEIQQGELRLGYERELGSKKMVPFLCADLGYSYSEAKGFASVFSDITRYNDQEYFVKTNRYFINAGIGLKYKMSNKLTLTYEGGFVYGTYHSKDYKNNPYNPQYTRRFNMFNPVRTLGLSILL